MSEQTYLNMININQLRKEVVAIWISIILVFAVTIMTAYYIETRLPHKYCEDKIVSEFVNVELRDGHYSYSPMSKLHKLLSEDYKVDCTKDAQFSETYGSDNYLAFYGNGTFIINYKIEECEIR